MHPSTILYDDRTTGGLPAVVAGEQLWLAKDDLATATGWKLEPEGLCRGDACVRTDPAWLDAESRVDLAAFAGYLGQPAIREGDTWAFGEPVNEVRDQLLSLQAPDFTLPDLDGRLHSLSDFRGKKVFLFSWGSY
jgi:hypothetical protein